MLLSQEETCGREDISGSPVGKIEELGRIESPQETILGAAFGQMDSGREKSKGVLLFIRSRKVEAE